MVRARDVLLVPELLQLPADTGEVSAAPTAGDNGPLLSLEEMEAAHIQRVLNHTRGHKGQTCEILGISRPALDRKISKYGLHVPK